MAAVTAGAAARYRAHHGRALARCGSCCAAVASARRGAVACRRWLRPALRSAVLARLQPSQQLEALQQRTGGTNEADESALEEARARHNGDGCTRRACRDSGCAMGSRQQCSEGQALVPHEEPSSPCCTYGAQRHCYIRVSTARASYCVQSAPPYLRRWLRWRGSFGLTRPCGRFVRAGAVVRCARREPPALPRCCHQCHA